MKEMGVRAGRKDVVGRVIMPEDGCRVQLWNCREQLERSEDPAWTGVCLVRR